MGQHPYLSRSAEARSQPTQSQPPAGPKGTGGDELWVEKWKPKVRLPVQAQGVTTW